MYICIQSVGATRILEKLSLSSCSARGWHQQSFEFRVQGVLGCRVRDWVWLLLVKCLGDVVFIVRGSDICGSLVSLTCATGACVC